MLDKMAASSEYGPSYEAAVKKNFITFETSVGGIISKVELGEVDAGYVYVTDAMASGSKVKSIDIPEEFNVIANYPIATAKASKNLPTAQAFVDFVLSPSGQKTLKAAGFGPA
jgi:molybdate transport system substrate-binding protein